MFRSDEARIHFKAAPTNGIVVKTSAKVAAAELGHAQLAALQAVFRQCMLQQQGPMSDALNLPILLCAGEIVKQKHRTFAAREKALQREYLTAISKRTSGEQSQFGKRVEHDASGPDAFDIGEDFLRRLAKFHFRWVKHGVLGGRGKRLFGRDEFTYQHSFQRPAVR